MTTTNHTSLQSKMSGTDMTDICFQSERLRNTMIIDEQTQVGVRIIQGTNIDGLVHLLVEKNPALAQELSDKIAWKLQDNDLTEGENNAS